MMFNKTTQANQMLDMMQQPQAYLPQADTDTMHFYQAMKESDRQEFINAIVDEVNTHTVHKHWKLVPRTEVSEGVKMQLPASIEMKERNSSRHVLKLKKNLYGQKQAGQDPAARRLIEQS
eukprot:14352982-Ditylum_brightwellii.AAC.1